MRRLVLLTSILVCGAACAGVLAGALTDKRGFHVTALVIALPIVCAAATLGAVVGIRMSNRHGELSQALQWDRQTRRRVGKSLRKGGTVVAADQEAARSIIGIWERRSWLGWLYLCFGACWLLSSIAAHGAMRWWDVALSICYLAAAPYWMHVRRRVLRHEANGGRTQPP